MAIMSEKHSYIHKMNIFWGKKHTEFCTKKYISQIKVSDIKVLLTF